MRRATPPVCRLRSCLRRSVTAILLAWMIVNARSARAWPVDGRQSQEPAGPPVVLRTPSCAQVGRTGPPYTLVNRRLDAPPGESAPSCEFSFTLPSTPSDNRWGLHVRVVSRGAVVAVKVSGSATNWLPDQTQFDVGSDGAVPDVELPLPSGLEGRVLIERADLGGAPTDFEVAIEVGTGTTPPVNVLDDQRVSLDSGRTFRVGLSPQNYRALVTLGQAVSAQSGADPTLKTEVHRVVSRLMARDAGQWLHSATRSEPVTMFVGLAGVNKIVLSDAVAWPMPASGSGGERLAEPWQTTFERARYFWALYLEDDESPFFTSIDVQYGTRESRTQHDDFDPQGVARFDVEVGSGGLVPVRIGYKRLRIPDNLNVVQVTFNRQSSSYGLRQWSRTYSRYGRFPVRVAAGVLATFWPVTSRDLVFTPVYSGDSQQASAYAVSDDLTRQPIFAMVAIRFPQLRDSAGQAPVGLSRLWRILLPEPVLGLGVPTITRRDVNGRTKLAGFREQSVLAGVSWPILGDRIHFVAASVRFHEALSRPGVAGLAVGSRYPVTANIDDLRERHSTWSLLGGIAIDLARTW